MVRAGWGRERGSRNWNSGTITRGLVMEGGCSDGCSGFLDLESGRTRQAADVLDFWISSWINVVLAKSLSRASEFWNSTTRLVNMEFWNHYILELWNKRV